MRTEEELRKKIRKIEESHQCYKWETGMLDREMKIRACNKIWGILYALGYGEEEILRLEGGDLLPEMYEVMPDESNMILTDSQKRDYSRGMNECPLCSVQNCKRRIIIDYCGLGDVPRNDDPCPDRVVRCEYPFRAICPRCGSTQPPYPSKFAGVEPDKPGYSGENTYKGAFTQWCENTDSHIVTEWTCPTCGYVWTP
jgi:hypothetical protein